MNDAPAPRPTNRTLFALGILAVGVVFAAYSNHFHNSFHFDDGTVIQNNAYLRSLHNIPLFFRDAATFSSYPLNAAYRPLTSTSFALDYWLGGGADPFFFHVTQWSLHLALGILVYLLLERVLALAGLGETRVPALFGAALFCLHRVNSETVNFLTLRSEILAALGVVGSFVLYQRMPSVRRTFVWLLPALAGAFAKQSALVFAPLFAVYLLVFPQERATGPRRGDETRPWSWLRLALPAFVAAGAFYILQARLGGPHLVYGATRPRIYLQTQVFAWLHYFRLFLLPLGLSADADWSPIPLWYDTRVLAGAAFAIVLLAAAAAYARRRPAGRAALFGAIWYFAALAPTSSLFPLSEMVNEHRPYLPYVGLILCLTAVAADACAAMHSPRSVRWLATAAALLLVAHGFGTFQRNRAWRDEESLWRSVTEASPSNGRAWMNYGLIFLARADYPNARACFEKAATLAPNYDILEINRGILEGATGHPAEAERHFRRALALNSSIATAHFYFGRWLHENGRDPEAAVELAEAVEINPADLGARELLLDLYERLGERERGCAAARATLSVVPGNVKAAEAASRLCGLS